MARIGFGVGLGGGRAGGEVLEGAPEDFSLVAVATDIGVAPSTTRITLGATQNALRVFADLYAAAEPFFYLYAKRNGDAAQKIKIYPWSARILSGAAGDTFAFSTEDGRTLSMAAMTVPGALESAFPETGTANADNGCPPYWTPSAAHVTLAATGSAFQLADTSTSELVFIREFDGTNWTPTRWVRKQSGRATTVRCTYQQIALATLDGATLSIAAPTGAVIGGASALAANPYMPAVTGVTHNVTDVATFKTASAAAVAGDEIVLAAGSYPLDVSVVHGTFAANEALGRRSFEGILIRGGTGDKADVVITGNASGTNGTWTLLNNTQGTLFAGLQDLTFDFTGINANFVISAGKLAVQDVRMTGISSPALDHFQFGSNNVGAMALEALRMTCDNGGDDLFNGSGDALFNPTSRCRMVQCSGVGSGAGSATAQCLTTHAGLPVEWYGGLLSDAHTNVAAPDAITSPIYIFFATVTKGGHDSGVQNCTLFGCTVAGRLSSTIGAEGGSLFSVITLTGATSVNNIFRNQVTDARHNLLVANAGRAMFSSNNSGIHDYRYNITVGFSEAAYNLSSSGAGGGNVFAGNTFINCTKAIGLEDANIINTIKNNVAKGSTTGINCTATTMSHTTTDYNTIDPVVDVDFVAGANDLVAGDAALDAFYFPTAAGNCDGNGDTTLEDYIGDCDPWGYVRVYKPDRVSRGARERPAIYSGAYLQPDLF